jgi:hypothetical protein
MDILLIAIGPMIFGIGVWYLLGAWQSFLVRVASQHDLPTRLKVAARWYVLGVIPIMLALIAGTFMMSLILIRRIGGEPHILLLLVLGTYVLTAYPAYARWFKASKERIALGFKG